MHMSKSKCTKHTMLGALLEVVMLKKCTTLWREARFQVKMLKTPGVRNTFGSWDVQKVYAVAAESTFRNQHVPSTSASEHFWKLRCSKSVRRCGAKTISKSKFTNTTCSRYFWALKRRFVWQVQGILHASISKNDGRPGTFEEDLQKSILRGRRITREIFIREEMLGGQAADFLRGAAFWSIQIFIRFAKMICLTGAALRMTWHHFCLAGAAL